MSENRLEILLDELLSGRIKPEDAALFVTYVDDPRHRAELEALLTQRFDNDDYEVMPGLVRQAKVKAMVLEKIGESGKRAESAERAEGIEVWAEGEAERPGKVGAVGQAGAEDAEVRETRRRTIPLVRWAAAAAVLLLLAGAGWWYAGHRHGGEKPLAENIFHNDVQPGSNKAILQLADGSTIALTDAGDGKLAEQGDARVIKRNGGLIYEMGKGEGTGGNEAGGAGTQGAGGNGSGAGADGGGGKTGGQSKDVYYNMVSTPAAGQYHLVLADGTQVWLDALSSIRYPTAFSSGKREVEIRGQAYLEVARHAAQPFFVKVKGERVEVLGTSFNINAYDDEPSLRTTLVEGAVRIVAESNGASLLLKPGEQAELDGGAGLKLLAGADMEATLAWKNGLFSYNGAPIEKIMREVSRWYGVEVVYGDKIKEQFVAEIPRDVPLTRLLTLLSGTRQVHFSVENKKVTVLR